jgi:hypothetical protein
VWVSEDYQFVCDTNMQVEEEAFFPKNSLLWRGIF